MRRNVPIPEGDTLQKCYDFSIIYRRVTFKLRKDHQELLLKIMDLTLGRVMEILSYFQGSLFVHHQNYP